MLSEKYGVKDFEETMSRLNPCFNGICSLSFREMAIIDNYAGGLNPCFNGICSLRPYSVIWKEKRTFVLILVLMEYAL